MLKTIETEQLRQRIGSPNPPLLLEALPERYYLQKHLPRAQLFPHDQVAKLAPIVAPDVTTEIVVYCASRTCQNSRIAAQHLVGLGYRNVAVYEGGKLEWEESGMPFESGAPTATTMHQAAA
jgi:rhodanese-related sulfurtransferase